MTDEPLTSVSWSNMVAPLSRLNADGEIDAFLGTGFVAAASAPLFVTARHLLHDNSLASGQRYHMLFQAPDESLIHLYAEDDDVVLSSRYDVAAIRLAGWPDVWPLYLDPEEIAFNEPVCCREYSGNRLQVDRITGKRTLKLRPRNHFGNVMSWYTSDFPESYPAPSCDVSFPALQGASGAPIVRNLMQNVVGILVANVEQALEPAQVLTVQVDDVTREETRYFMPIGKGLCSSALIDFLEQECSVTCDTPPVRYLPGQLV